MSAELERIEQIIDACGVARRIELLLPIGVRPRQLSVRTLLTGMLLAAVHGRPAHLRRVHQALLDLDAPDQHRLAIITQCTTGPHLLTYRQLRRPGRIAALFCLNASVRTSARREGVNGSANMTRSWC